MANDFYTHSSYPATGSQGSSALARAEFDAVMAGFDKMPALAGNAGKFVVVNSGASALSVASSLSESAGNLSIAGSQLTVAPATITWSGNPTHSGNHTFGGNLAVTGTSTFTGAGTFSSTLTVGGTSTFSSTLTVGGTSTFTGAGTFSSTLTVNGTSSLSATNVRGTAGAYSFRVIDAAGVGDRLRVVAGTAGNGVAIDVTDNAETTTARALTLGASNGTVNLGSGTQLTKDASGNIGIGGAPSQILDIVRSQNAPTLVRVSNPNAGVNSYVAYQTVSDTGAGVFATFSSASGTPNQTWLYTLGAHPLILGTAGAERVRIDSSGNVGIGKTPGQKLDVQLGRGTWNTYETSNGIAWTGAAAGGYASGIQFTDVAASHRWQIVKDAASDTLSFYGGGDYWVSSGILYGRFGANGFSACSSQNANGLSALFRAGPTGTNGGALNFYNWNNSSADINLARIYCQTTSSAVGNEAGDLYFYTKPSGGALTSRLRIQDAGQVDIQAGSGNLRIGGSITRFESAEQSTPTTTTLTSVAHGGPRAPDIIRVVYRCKTAEHGFSVGDEIDVRDDVGDTSREVQVYANATNVAFQYIGAGLAPAIRNTSNTTVALTAANWRVVLRCIWL